MTYNPSLRQIPRRQAADVLPTQQEPSILVWLEGTGRLKPREDASTPRTDEADNEEITELMGDGEKDFDDDLDLDDDDS